MQVILVRHGETEYNAQGRLQGYSPVPLSMAWASAGHAGRAACPALTSNRAL